MNYSELKPEIIFSYFKQLSDIPRGSGNEAAAAKFVYETAIRLGHTASVDSANNVLVTAKATPGYEDHPAVMLQGHLDMVCEANRGTAHDFLTDPIKLILDGDILHADGTTLGADNGVAVALMLSVLGSDIPHPALECLFTTDEENGLTGMRAFDASGVKSRLMINLDSAGEGIATVSCAGGVRCHMDFPAGEKLPVPEGFRVLDFEVSGLFGGHSGEDIHLGRIGAIAAAARILHAASKSADIRICSIEGGSRDNAIPRECFVTLAVSDEAAFTAAVRETEAKIRGELVADDAGMTVKISAGAAGDCASAEKTTALISLLRSLPHGVHGMSRTVEDLVETSSNLAVIRSSDAGWEIVVTPRSSVESRLDDMQERLECAGALVGAKVWHVNRYPGWDYTVGSPLQQLYLDCYRELFGAEAKVCGIHAGLECGLLKGKLPDMDMISIGPDIRNLHSPDETMSVSSYVRLWDLLCLMLKKA